LRWGSLRRIDIIERNLGRQGANGGQINWASDIFLQAEHALSRSNDQETSKCIVAIGIRVEQKYYAFILKTWMDIHPHPVILLCIHSFTVSHTLHWHHPGLPVTHNKDYHSTYNMLEHQCGNIKEWTVGLALPPKLRCNPNYLDIAD
jgi:hypothetical protein